MADRRVVVTGMGLITGLGEKVDTFWSRLIAGESGVRRISPSLFSTELFDAKIGGECFYYKAENYFDRKMLKRLDRCAQFALAASREAVESAGISKEAYAGDRRRVGAILGSGIGGLNEFEQQHVRLRDKGPDKVSAFTIPKLMINAAVGNLAIEHGFRGITTMVGTACASAGHAMRDAYLAIKTDSADVVVTGGTEAALTPLGLSAFCAMKALSTRNDAPELASRPFDRDRDGFVLGEGAGLLVFEELEHAKKRGVRIWAELLGFGATTDAGHIAQPALDGAGAAESMRQCMAAAKVNPDQIDYVNAHGTSTGLGDIAETVAVKRAFGPAADQLAISSTKSSIGHLLGASGGVEAIATVMAIVNSTLPATLNLENPDAECDLDYVPKTPRDKHIQYAMSNSFGFGGHNATVMFGRFD